MGEMDDLVNVVQNPNEYKIPAWMLNSRKDFKDGKTSQVSSNQIDAKLRDDLERLKKIRNHRGLLTTGGSVCAVSTPRPRAAVARPWVCPRRRANFHAPKQSLLHLCAYAIYSLYSDCSKAVCFEK